jgi:hypothetical protein
MNHGKQHKQQNGDRLDRGIVYDYGTHFFYARVAVEDRPDKSQAQAQGRKRENTRYDQMPCFSFKEFRFLHE